jgi:predicted nucleic-acid-binding protein
VIGLDTNILLRFVLRDDEAQYAKAEALLRDGFTESDPGYVNIVALVEFCWTLRRTAKLANGRIREAVSLLLETENLFVERAETVAYAIWLSAEKGLEVPDALLAAINREDGCRKTLTFDKAFAEAGGAELLV